MGIIHFPPFTSGCCQAGRDSQGTPLASDSPNSPSHPDSLVISLCHSPQWSGVLSNPFGEVLSSGSCLKAPLSGAVCIWREYEFFVMDRGGEFFFFGSKSWTSATISLISNILKSCRQQWISLCKSRCCSFPLCLKQDNSYFRKLYVPGPPQSNIKLEFSGSLLGLAASRTHLLITPSHTLSPNDIFSLLPRCPCSWCPSSLTCPSSHLYSLRHYLFTAVLFKGDHDTTCSLVAQSPVIRPPSFIPVCFTPQQGMKWGELWGKSPVTCPPACSPSVWTLRGQWCWFCSWHPSTWHRAWHTVGSVLTEFNPWS